MKDKQKTEQISYDLITKFMDEVSHLSCSNLMKSRIACNVAISILGSIVSPMPKEIRVEVLDDCIKTINIFLEENDGNSLR